jgi:hypothetical protein
MTRLGVDYSTRPANWDTFAGQLKAAGYSFVGRYLSANPKGITSAELAAMQKAGIDVYLYWETTANRALQGAQAGAQDAKAAEGLLATLGIPATTPVYFTVDTDTTGPAVKAYFSGIASVVPVAQIGVYGSYQVVDYLLDNGLAHYANQTLAWSHKLVREGINLYQNGGAVIGGVSCDTETAYTADFGQVKRPTPAPTPVAVKTITLDYDRPVLKYGDHGPWVTAMQKLLINHKYSVGATGADGDFGDGTEAGLRAMQTYVNGYVVSGKVRLYDPKSKTNLAHMTVDGVCGPQSWGALTQT